ncbi:hypothetical protein CRYUN_Cryun17cG0075200 [Craigia yunnanensis]
MAVSTSFLPIISFSPISSSSSSSFLGPTPVKTHNQGSLIVSQQISFRRLVINCSASSDMDSSPDPMNLSGGSLSWSLNFDAHCGFCSGIAYHMSSMAPFGMQMNGKPSYKWRRVLLKITMAIAREVACVTRLGIAASLKPLLPFICFVAFFFFL